MEVFKLGRIFKHRDTNVVIENGYEIKTGLIDYKTGEGPIVASFARPADWRSRPLSWINKIDFSNGDGNESSYLSCIRNVSEWLDEDIVALATYDASSKDYQMLCDYLDKFGIHNDFAYYVRECCMPHGYQTPYCREDLEAFYKGMSELEFDPMMITAFTMIRYSVPIFISSTAGIHQKGYAYLGCCPNKYHDHRIFGKYCYNGRIDPMSSLSGHRYHSESSIDTSLIINELEDTQLIERLRSRSSLDTNPISGSQDDIDKWLIERLCLMVETFWCDEVVAMGSSNPVVYIMIPTWEGRFWNESTKMVHKTPRIVR